MFSTWYPELQHQALQALFFSIASDQSKCLQAVSLFCLLIKLMHWHNIEEQIPDGETQHCDSIILEHKFREMIYSSPGPQKQASSSLFLLSSCSTARRMGEYLYWMMDCLTSTPREFYQTGALPLNTSVL